MENIIAIQPATTIDRAHGFELLYQMMMTRRFEEKAAELYTKMKIRGFLHLYVGEEAVAVGVMHARCKSYNRSF